MFDLEQSIAEWRQQMLTAGIKPPALEELENHLREEIEQQLRAGLSARSAFDAAVTQIGRPAPLQEEFTKAGEARYALWERFKTLFGLNKVVVPFDTAAYQTLGFAAGEARGFHHNFIGTEHILLGLIKSESGIVSKVLRRLGVEGRAVRVEIEKFVGNGPAHEIPVNLPYTPRVKNALRLAAQEARALNHSHINPEHIFLGLILEDDGVAARVLKNFGVRLESAREEVLRETGASPGAAE